MSGETNAEVYASFGINSAVMTGESLSEHEQNMLALDVAARDGDDAIEVKEDEEEQEVTERDLYDNTDPFGMEDDEDRIQVRVSEDGDVEETTEEASEEVTTEEEGAEFTPLADVPEELSTASEQLAEHEQGLQEMIDTAAERGLSVEAITRIQEEYMDEGLSEKSYAELEAVGYSRAFIDSYIRGQEALVDSYVAGIKAYAGGAEQFDSLYSHLENTNPEAAESLINAMEARDLSTVKAIINLAGASRSKTYGVKPTRSVTQRATPAKPQAPKKEGFASRSEMIKAMSDPRYGRDAAYRASVEQKVWNSNF